MKFWKQFARCCLAGTAIVAVFVAFVGGYAVGYLNGYQNGGEKLQYQQWQESWKPDTEHGGIIHELHQHL